MNNTLKPNLSQAIEFLSEFHGRKSWHLVAIDPDADDSGLTAKTFKCSDKDAAYRWLDERQAKANCYFHVNRPKQTFKDRKAKKDDIAAARFAHVDVDDPSDEALNRLRSFEPCPTVILFSGGGYQAFWKFDEVTKDLGRVERINLALASALGGDNCHNIDRIMRIPGTINVPNAKKRAAGRVPALAYVVDGHEFNADRAYALDDFPKADSAVANSNRSAPDNIPIVDFDDIEVAISVDVRDVTAQGDDQTRPIGGNDARFRSRSDAVWFVAVQLALRGVDATAIAGLLLNPKLAISESILEKRSPKRDAWRTATRAVAATADGWPDVYKNLKPRPTLPNAMLALLRLSLKFEYDAFHNRKRVEGHPLQIYQGDLTDDTCAVIRKIVVEEFGFDPYKGNILDVVQILCLEHWVHPILSYLDSLVWDGQPRLARLLIDYFGAEDTELNQAIGKIVLAAAVRRVRQPGCKFDTALILEGPQGSGKSTALTILAGAKNFSDQEILTLDSKSQMELLEGVWIYELSELEGLRHTDTGKLKAFISRTEDRGRRAYGRFKDTWPRQCIFIGTTNDDQYLKDVTGNRRFWPVSTTTIELDALRRDRDQLWAEAAYWEAKEESLILPEELWPTAAQEQEKRLLDDPWLDILEQVTGEAVGEFERVRTEWLFSEGNLNTPPERRHDYTLKRAAEIMRKLGWDGPKKLRFPGGQVARGYERPKRKKRQQPACPESDY